MGLFDRLFGPVSTEPPVRGYFQLLTAYRPVFTSRAGGLYEMAQTRAAVHAIATHCSKLKPNVLGTSDKRLARLLQVHPNPWMDTTKFLYRTATILEAENTAFLVPVLDDRGRTVGAFPILPSSCEIVEGTGGQLYLRFRFSSGKCAAVEYERCGVLTKMQYKSDLFGEGNGALNPTLDLLHTQIQAIEQGVQQSAAVRFMAKLGSTVRPEDLKAEQQRFRQLNLSMDNYGGVAIFDAKYSQVEQVKSDPFIVDDKQMELINRSVESYFGVNDDILRNRFNADTWDAFYEGKIEPFALQLSLVMTNMFFSDKQQAQGCEILWSANRLQFATTADKMNVITSLFDRGMLSRNEGRELLQMPPIEGEDGDLYYIRGEYIESDEKTPARPADDKKGGEPNAGDQ